MEKIYDLFLHNVEKFPDKTAIFCGTKKITYQEFATLVDQYASFLLANGVNYKDHIGIPMNNSIESVGLIFACAKIGACLVPVNPTMPLNAMKISFDFADVKHIIARKNFFELIKKNEVNFPEFSCKFCIDESLDGTISLLDSNYTSDCSPDYSLEKNIIGEESLIITMTSGSTGQPKPIDLTQDNKLLRAKAHIDTYEITQKDNILVATPLYHSLAQRLVIMPLISGATCTILPRFTPKLWLDCIKEQKVTFTIAVSAQLSQISAFLSSPFLPSIDSLRCIVSSSALLETFTKKELIQKLKCSFHEMYGTSETSTLTDIPFEKYPLKKDSVGRPLEGVSVLILNEKMEVAQRGEIGEILCKTPLICNGYYKQPHLFSENHWNGYFKTGDYGYLDQDGFLYFSARKKEIIITGGINVYPQDVENCILGIKGVKECAAFPYADKTLGEVVCVAVVLDKDSKLTKRQIQVQCAKNLADFQQPHHIFFIEDLPKNEMGKVKKNTLIEYIKIK